MGSTPRVLFACVHNAGRSQMAAALLRVYAGDAVEVLSAGSEPAGKVNPEVVLAMAERHIDLAEQSPRLLTTEAVRRSDVVVTMGCGDTCPFFPGKRYLDWDLADPAGKSLSEMRSTGASATCSLNWCQIRFPARQPPANFESRSAPGTRRPR